MNSQIYFFRVAMPKNRSFGWHGGFSALVGLDRGSVCDRKNVHPKNPSKKRPSRNCVSPWIFQGKTVGEEGLEPTTSTV